MGGGVRWYSSIADDWPQVRPKRKKMTMSKKVENALIALGVAVFILIGGTGDDVLPQHPHVCVDLTHAECDGECGCDGMECPKK